MTTGARLRRLEQVEYEAMLLRYARWIEERHGQPIPETLERMKEIERQIAREGVAAQYERLARDYGETVEEVEAAYHRIVAEFAAWEAEQGV